MPTFSELDDLFILHIQYKGFWLPSDARNQGICSHGMEIIILKYCKLSNIRNTKSHNLNVSHLGLQLSLRNRLKC